MKILKCFLFILFLLLVSNLNAQIFIGGDFNFSTSKIRQTDGNTTLADNSSNTFSLYPFLGKFTSDRFALGISLHSWFSTSKVSTISSKAYTIGISPFIRYYAINWNKFSIFGVGNIGLDFTKSNLKTTESYINFYPGLSYNVNERLALETGIGVLNIGFSYSVGKDGSVRDKRTSFNIGGGLDNISAVQNIIVGAIIKFNK